MDPRIPTQLEQRVQGEIRNDAADDRALAGAMTFNCNDGEHAFKKVSRCSPQQNRCRIRSLHVTTRGEEQ
jgi:hypothetical protein